MGNVTTPSSSGFCFNAQTSESSDEETYGGLVRLALHSLHFASVLVRKVDTLYGTRAGGALWSVATGGVLSQSKASPRALPSSARLSTADEAFIATIGVADPAGLAARMRSEGLTVSDLRELGSAALTDGLRQDAWNELFAALNITGVAERNRLRSAVARLQ